MGEFMRDDIVEPRVAAAQVKIEIVGPEDNEIKIGKSESVALVTVLKEDLGLVRQMNIIDFLVYDV